SRATLTFTYPDGSTHAGARTPTYVSPSQLSYQFNNASDPGTWHVVVTNPGTGGQSSNSYPFTVN
ncbi:hypothetical protein B1A_06383, partial [mine drainage metagenome]